MIDDSECKSWRIPGQESDKPLQTKFALKADQHFSERIFLKHDQGKSVSFEILHESFRKTTGRRITQHT